MKPLPRLYAIADASYGDPVAVAESLFAGGIRLLQVRNKKAASSELLEQVKRIVSSAPADALVIVNDRLDIALLAGAGGVHLGQEDIPPAEARRILGYDKLVGYSTHSLKQATEAEDLPVDYIAVGPIFATVTKENADPVVGVETLSKICQATHKPIVAIGGIQLENAVKVLKAGAASVAVVRDLLACPNVLARARTWIEELNALHG
jgi:thiamine-phosphate pyrophosphorylase